MSAPLLQVQALGMEIGGRCLWHDLDWQVAPGECWAILGRNGAGKSSLMRCLAGIACPERGQISIAGKPLAQWPLLELARQRAFMPQSRHDPFGYSVLQAVQSARHPWQSQAWWQAEDMTEAWQALREMEVEHLAQRDVRSLSGGERQRVAIAALLAQHTPLLLLDEPAAALDLAHQMSVTDTLARLCREQGRAVVMVGHDVNLAMRCASHVLLLYGDGRWQAGPSAQVMQVDIIGDCLGYPLTECQHQGRRVFLPL